MNHVEEFLVYLTTEQRSSRHTAEAYERDLRQFSDWLAECEGKPIKAEEVTTADIREWIGFLAEEGLTATSLRRKTQSLRAFYKWGMRRGIFSKNPAADIILAKKRRKLPNFIKADELEELLSENSHDTTLSIDNSSFENFKRNRAHVIVELLYSLGLRQAELLLLTDADINLNSAEIKITGKRNKQRVLPLPSKLEQAITNWQRVRDSRYPELPHPKPLIAGPHGVISKYQLYKIVKDTLSETSAGRRSPHTLRHSFATAMINNGAELDSVREMMGHSSLSTTQIYTHLSFKELIDNYRAGHPRAEKE